jgi:NADPH-dependent 2,4-dienoyl-CoA reductase/sulfur reductase-like enzyme
MDRVIPNYFDPEFTDIVEKRMKKGIDGKGIKLALGEKVAEFIGQNGKVTEVVTNKGKYKADLVIMSIGFIPMTQMLKGQVEMIPNGAIKVNEYQVSSNKDVYAIGDSSAIFHNVFKSKQNVALATNAVKTGIVAAMHITQGEGIKFPGVQGTNAISIYGCHYASTGLSEESLKRFKIPYKAESFEDNDRPEFMRKYGKVKIKITYDPKSLKLLGAQLGT